MTEINSDDSLYTILANKRAKSPPCVEGSAKKTRMKCTPACIRTIKRDRCTGAADRASASLHCSDAVQKTYRPVSQHDRGSTCVKTTVECRGQCPRTGKYAASDSPQCNKTRSYRSNESQCTGVAEKCSGAADNTQCTVTRSYRANEVQCTGNFGANNNRCTGMGNYSSNNNCSNGCNGCRCISAAAAVTAAATCLGGPKACGRGSADTLFSTVCKWARVVVDWTWDKKSYTLVAIVAFFLGMYYDWCLCTCEEAF